MNIRFPEGKNAVLFYVAGIVIATFGLIFNIDRHSAIENTLTVAWIGFMVWRIIQIGRGKKWERK
jgi:hypothetical protein